MWPYGLVNTTLLWHVHKLNTIFLVYFFIGAFIKRSIDPLMILSDYSLYRSLLS